MIHLSKRLAGVAAMVSEDCRLLDVGTDHGYIPIALVNEGRILSAIAMDINEGPLQKAKDNIRRYGLEQQIQTRLSDGLDQFQAGEADSIVIAGMGGLLMTEILDRGHGAGRLLGIRELVLQPQSDIDQVRRWLHGHGWSIFQENMVYDAGKYYVMMRAVPGMQKYNHEYEYIYGGSLIDQGHSVLKEYLKKQITSLSQRHQQLLSVDTPGAKGYLPVLEQQLEQLWYVLELTDAPCVDEQ